MTKNEKFGQRTKFQPKNQNFDQMSKFYSDIKIWPKVIIEILESNQNLGQKHDLVKILFKKKSKF